MERKYKYLVTTERATYMCKRELQMDFYTLNYPLNSKENIEKFLKKINPFIGDPQAHRLRYVHLVILYIKKLSTLEV